MCVTMRCISFTLAGQQKETKSLIRPPRRRKGAKRPNMYSPASGKGPLQQELLSIKLPMKLTGPNVLLDDRGRPDDSVDYDWMEERQDAPQLVRRTMHKLPTEVDPTFNRLFNGAKHGKYLQQHLKTDHLEPATARRLVALVKKYWCVFDPDGLK